MDKSSKNGIDEWWAASCDKNVAITGKREVRKNQKYGFFDDENTNARTKPKPKSKGSKAPTKCKTNAIGKKSGKPSKKSKKSTFIFGSGSDTTPWLYISQYQKSRNVVSYEDNNAISCTYLIPTAFLNPLT